MEFLRETFGSIVTPIIIVMLAVAFVLAVKYIVSRRKQIPPGMVGIFYGRKYKWPDGTERGYLVMTGGGRMLIPFFESYMQMPTTAFQIPINEEDIPNKDNVKFMVKGVATCKVSTDPNGLNKAIDALIDKLSAGGQRGGGGNTPVEQFVLNILQGHLRSIVGKLDINQLLRERDQFNQQVIAESKIELAELGIELKTLVIQDIKDGEGYIDALGKQAVADAKAEAEIKIADANRRQTIAVSDADRESKTVQAKNAATIADAEKDRDLKVAGFKKQTETARAEADMAGEIARAAQGQTLKVAEAERDAAAATAGVKVQEAEATRMEKQLLVTVIRPAEAQRQADVIAAEALKQTRTLGAEADAAVLTATAEAKKNATVLEGEGTSRATEMNLVAKAKGDAAGAREVLLAQAEGTERLNAALKDMTDSAKMILILDRLPLLLDKGGDAGSKMVSAMFGPIGAAIGAIDSVRIVDMGGSGKGVGNMASTVTDTVLQVLAQLKAKGISVDNLAKMVGVDLSGLNAMLAGVDPQVTPGASPASKE